MKPTLIDISKREHHKDYYDRSRDMATALAWNAIKKVLHEHHREELFGPIQSVRLTDKHIIITTMKPIVNAEIKMYAEEILSRFQEAMKLFGGRSREGIKLK